MVDTKSMLDQNQKTIKPGKRSRIALVILCLSTFLIDSRTTLIVWYNLVTPSHSVTKKASKALFREKRWPFALAVVVFLLEIPQRMVLATFTKYSSSLE